jgi:hypothetical protein
MTREQLLRLLLNYNPEFIRQLEERASSSPSRR